MSSAAPTSFQPCGVLVLLTDFGSQDPYVGVMKGVALGIAPRAALVDLTHAVPPQDVRRAAWFLERTRGHFPPGTVFLCVVDPGVGSTRGLLAAFDGAQAFVAPDNGLLAPALSAAARVFELDPARLGGARASATFHGRDHLAPAAARLVAGAPIEDFARALERPPVPLVLPRVLARAPHELAAEVLFADHYGNLILSAQERDLAGGAEGWEVHAAGRRLRLVRTYADAAPGELVALVDSYAALELAVREGSAAAVLGLRSGAEVILRRRA